VREAGAKAFAHWASEHNVDALVRLTEDESTPVRRAAMEALGRLHAQSAVGSLAARLTVPADRASASRALAEIGAASETAVLAYLDHSEWSLRLTAVHILRDVGGGNSLARLEEVAADDPQENVRTWANLAVESIRQRLAEQP
jgi:HEAT repeat protein